MKESESNRSVSSFSHLSDCAWNDPELRLRLTQLEAGAHGVRLAAPRLAVRKDRSIVPGIRERKINHLSTELVRAIDIAYI